MSSLRMAKLLALFVAGHVAGSSAIPHREAFVALSNIRYNLTLPNGVQKEEHIVAGQFQREISRFLAKEAPPPLSIAYQIVVHSDLHQVIAHDCLPCFALAHLLVAECLIYLYPEAALGMAQDVSSIIQNWNPSAWEDKAWGIQAILHRVSAAQQRALAPAQNNEQVWLDIVIARCGEDFSWVLDMPFPKDKTRIFLKEKCEDVAVDANSLAVLRSNFPAGVDVETLLNQGMESLAYARHVRKVVDREIVPAEYTLFLQAEPFKHLDRELLSWVAQAISAQSLQREPIGFLHLNNMRFTDVQSMCLMDIYKRLIPDFPTPDTVFGAYCCSQFMVHRSRLMSVDPTVIRTVQGILGDPHEARPADLLCVQDNKHDDRPGIAMSALFETLWQVVFGVGPYLPLRQDDDSLPLFLRDAHDWSDGSGPFNYHLHYQGQFA